MFQYTLLQNRTSPRTPWHDKCRTLRSQLRRLQNSPKNLCQGSKRHMEPQKQPDSEQILFVQAARKSQIRASEQNRSAFDGTMMATQDDLRSRPVFSSHNPISEIRRMHRRSSRRRFDISGQIASGRTASPPQQLDRAFDQTPRHVRPRLQRPNNVVLQQYMPYRTPYRLPAQISREESLIGHSRY